MSPEWRKAVHAVDVLSRVRERLVSAGAMAEVSHFDRLSLDELDLLVLQERGVRA